MGWFDSDSDQYQAHSQVANLSGESEHQAKWSHELLAAAASYEAAKAYEDHVAANGQPDSHAKAKEILAGFVGAFIDRQFETKGLDFLDKEEAKRQANKQLHDASYDDYN